MDSPGINWSTASTAEVRRALSRGISAQITRALEVLDDHRDVASSVHEARRAIKRERALLRLVEPPPSDSFVDGALREASRALAVLRDSDVLVATAVTVCDGSRRLGPDVVPPQLLEALEEERKRRFGGSGSNDSPLREAGQILRSAADAVADNPALGAMPDGAQASTPTSGGTAPPDAMELLRLGLGASYESVRAQSRPDPDPRSGDEQSHKLRKRVKDLRYQLEFLASCETKFGRLVRDLRHLTDLLGDRNDLAMLLGYTASAMWSAPP